MMNLLMLLPLAATLRAADIAKPVSGDAVGAVLRAVPPQWHGAIGDFLLSPGAQAADLDARLGAIDLRGAVVPDLRPAAVAAGYDAGLTRPASEVERYHATARVVELIGAVGPHVASAEERGRLAETARQLSQALTPEHRTLLDDKMQRMAAALGGAATRDFIWQDRILPSAYAVLPESNGGWKNNLKALRTFLTLGKSFDHDGDALPASRGGFKLLHPFGSVLKVTYRGREGHPFTGLLAEREVPGLVRLSLGAPQKSGKFIPGTALKLFVDRGPSVNAVFLGERTGVDGQQPDKNFFAQAFTNLLPGARTTATKIAAWVLGLFNHGNALRIPVDLFGAYQLVLKPAAGRANASDTAREFREELAELPTGPLFEVYAAEANGGPLIHVGDIEAASRPVASEYGDKGLFFRHRRGKP